ncbi:MAG: hypothetical protein WC753_00660 [Candidatus Gracilibacteria bacterium]
MNTLTLISIFLALLTPIIGVRSIYKGEYKPQRMTRFLIFILTGIMFFSLLLQSRGAGVYLAGVQFLGSCVYFILSFKYGMGGASRLDFSVLVGVIAIGVIWSITSNPFLVLILSLGVDFIAFIPTFSKTWYYPHTESVPFYGCDVVAAMVNLIAISHIFSHDAVFSWYVLFLNLLMVLIIVFRRRYFLKEKVISI